MKHHQQHKEVHKHKQDAQVKAISGPDAPVKDISADLLKTLTLIRDQADNSPIVIRSMAAAAVAKAEK